MSRVAGILPASAVAVPAAGFVVRRKRKRRRRRRRSRGQNALATRGRDARDTVVERMALSVIGIDVNSASLPQREALALTPAQTTQVLGAIASERIFAEAVILSTCNRTEFYFAAEPGQEGAVEHLLAHVAEAKGAAHPPELTTLFRHDGLEAVRHLFRVASSLESQVVGEHEILGQVKEAYRLACEAQTAGFLFHKLMHWCFRASKRVMAETNLGQGTASVSQAAVDLAKQVFTSLAGKTAMLVGAGQTAELACQALVRNGVRNVVVANRTEANARQLADRFLQWGAQEALSPTGEDQGDGPVQCPALPKILSKCSLQPAPEVKPASPLQARAIRLDEVASALPETDLVICSTGAPEPVLRAGELGPVLSGLRRSLLMIDISVPRNIDPALEKFPNVFLHNIDGLEAVVARNLERRKQEVPRAAALVDDEVQGFAGWLASLGVVPTIKMLAQRMADLQQAELARYQKAFPAAQRPQLQEFARTLCAKILHDPIAFLRQLDGGDGHADMASVNTLRRIFDLDAKEEEA
jgi:glutamyl-tRNA reductase